VTAIEGGIGSSLTYLKYILLDKENFACAKLISGGGRP
jgi:hypothetical protein